jgi:DNA gyrase subunit A
VSISRAGYIKRTHVSAYKSQRRGGKGIIGAKVVDEDPIEHLFVTSTHKYLLFFTNLGQVYWHKVYALPNLDRTSKGRAIVNVLNLAPGEMIQDCLAVKDFDAPEHYLVLATKNGLVKKTALSAYRRPMKKGIIAITLREGDELIDATVVGPGNELLIATAQGRAVRFRHTDARAVSRSSIGVKAVRFRKDDYAIGMVTASPDWTLLTACENGYGKRTPIGPNGEEETTKAGMEHSAMTEDEDDETEAGMERSAMTEETENDETESTDDNTNLRYTTKNRGGLGLVNIKATERNGRVIGICRVRDEDEVMMITAKGQIQRIAVTDVRVMGRNTQGVRLMNLDKDDTLVAIKRIPKIDGAVESNDEEETEPLTEPQS